MKSRRFFVFISAFFLISLISCASSSSKSAYYEDNISDFFEYTLSNGIPVALKNNTGSQIAVIRVIFEGGTANLSKEESGLENLTLELMLHGSKKYPYQTIKRLSFDKSFGLTKSSSREFSTAGFTCIKRDIFEALDILSDSIQNPLFNENDFEQLYRLEEDGVQSSKTEPEAVLASTISDTIFENHPYASETHATEKSLKNLSLKAVKNHYASLVNASRMKIVCVGSFSQSEREDIFEKLNESFGEIEQKSFEKKAIPKIQITEGTVREVCAEAGSTGYATGFFSCPERTDFDYVPYVIATMFVDDAIFRIVREENGAVYSAGTGVMGASRFVGAVSLFKATKFEELGKIVRASFADFPKNEKEVSKKLDQYKNQFITQVFDNSRTAGGIASNITASWIFRDSPSDYLKRPSEVESITAKDVLEAYQKYLKPVSEGKIKWIIVSEKDSVSQFELD